MDAPPSHISHAEKGREGDTKTQWECEIPQRQFLVGHLERAANNVLESSVQSGDFKTGSRILVEARAG